MFSNDHEAEFATSIVASTNFANLLKEVLRKPVESSLLWDTCDLRIDWRCRLRDAEVKSIDVALFDSNMLKAPNLSWGSAESVALPIDLYIAQVGSFSF